MVAGAFVRLGRRSYGALRAKRLLRGFDQAVMRSPWAREYARTPNRYIWGTEASALAKEVGALLPPGARVLDLGCGEGRDSVFFASQGCDVTAVDVSRAGLRKAERLAREKGVTVRWIPGGMSRVMVDGPFDLIYSFVSIHYVPRRER